MKYLFVFLLIGLVSCGDASGEATKVSKANVNSHINENTDWTKILNCDDIDGVVATYSIMSHERQKEVYNRLLSQFSGYVKYCREDGGLKYLIGYRNGILVSDRKYGTKNDQRYLELERLKLDDGIQRTRYYELGYLYEERFQKNGKRYGTHREWKYQNHLLVREITFDDNGNPIKETIWHENGELFELYEFSSPGTYLLKKWDSATNLITEENFVNYQRDGLHREWNENGQLEIEMNYKDDKPNGLYKRYYENGGLREESNYKDWKLDGLYKSWYENGQLMNEHIYKDGNCVNAKCWDEDGNEIEC